MANSGSEHTPEDSLSTHAPTASRPRQHRATVTEYIKAEGKANLETINYERNRGNGNCQAKTTHAAALCNLKLALHKQEFAALALCTCFACGNARRKAYDASSRWGKYCAIIAELPLDILIAKRNGRSHDSSQQNGRLAR